MHQPWSPKRPAAARGALAGALLISLAISVLLFLARAHATGIVEELSWWTLLAPAALLTLGAAGGGAVLAGAVWVASHRTPSWGVAVVTGVSVVAVALLATTPLEVTYNDGCNINTDVAPALAVPYLKLARPVDSHVAYMGSTTLMACFPERTLGGR